MLELNLTLKCTKFSYGGACLRTSLEGSRSTHHSLTKSCGKHCTYILEGLRMSTFSADFHFGWTIIAFRLIWAASPVAGLAPETPPAGHWPQLHRHAGLEGHVGRGVSACLWGLHGALDTQNHHHSQMHYLTLTISTRVLNTSNVFPSEVMN